MGGYLGWQHCLPLAGATDRCASWTSPLQCIPGHVLCGGRGGGSLHIDLLLCLSLLIKNICDIEVIIPGFLWFGHRPRYGDYFCTAAHLWVYEGMNWQRKQYLKFGFGIKYNRKYWSLYLSASKEAGLSQDSWAKSSERRSLSNYWWSFSLLPILDTLSARLRGCFLEWIRMSAISLFRVQTGVFEKQENLFVLFNI